MLNNANEINSSLLEKLKARTLNSSKEVEFENEMDQDELEDDLEEETEEYEMDALEEMSYDFNA